MFRWGEKTWQDVGIAVCNHCPAMPPYCHFFTSNASTAKEMPPRSYTMSVISHSRGMFMFIRCYMSNKCLNYVIII